MAKEAEEKKGEKGEKPGKEDVESDIGESEKRKKVDKDAAKAAKATEAVTDYHFEKESRNIQAATEAMNSLPTVESKKAAATFTCTIADEDVTSIMEECDLAREEAEPLLRKAEGSLQKAMEIFVSGEICK